MADVITRFKLETTQYDSKLRDAAKGLSEYTKQATMAGNEFGKFTQKNVEVARSFGTIATSATNSKDKVKELVGAYNDVAKAYNALTKDQQSSDFGKALAQSMNTLKGRISEAKTEMNGTSGVLDTLKGKFTLNIDALKLFNMGLTAAKKALDFVRRIDYALSKLFGNSASSVHRCEKSSETCNCSFTGKLSVLHASHTVTYCEHQSVLVILSFVKSIHQCK